MEGVRDRYGLVPFLLYGLLSLLFFGRGLLGHFASFHIGVGEDPPLMMWCLVWWPHAITNRLNPILTDVIWSPLGFNLAWGSTIPLVSLLAAPLTYTVGPIAALNVLCLLCVALAVWATFLLCNYLTGNYWAALLSGYIVAFCPFMLGQLIFAHLHTISIFPIPLALYIAARRLDNNLDERLFIILLAVLLVMEFYFSLEMFATATMFGTMVLVFGWWFASGDLRARIWRIVINTSFSYIIAFFIVSPYIYYFFAVRFKHTPFWPVSSLSADLLNFVIPTPLNAMGRISEFESISGRFNMGIIAEEVGFSELAPRSDGCSLCAALSPRTNWPAVSRFTGRNPRLCARSEFDYSRSCFSRWPALDGGATTSAEQCRPCASADIRVPDDRGHGFILVDRISCKKSR